MDATELRRAYDILLAEVDAGGFGSPPHGQWSAEQIVAHVAANDELMIEATEAVIAGSPWVCYNHDVLHRHQLDELSADRGGLPGLARLLRSTSARMCELTGRLGDGSSTLVDTHIHEGVDLNIDEQLPWGRVIDIHGRLHLPHHTGQLRALRQ